MPACRRRSRHSSGSIPSGTAQAKPTIEDVQHRVDRLYHAAEQASERYNQIHVQLKQMRGDVAGAARRPGAPADSSTEKARRAVADSIVRQYEGDSLSAVGQAVVSSDPNAFVSQLTTMSAFNSMQAGQYSSYLTQAKALSIRQDATGSQLAKVARAREAGRPGQGDHRAQPGRGQERARQDEGRGARAACSRPRAATPPASRRADIPVSGRAAAAVRFAMAQIGKPYVYGAAGPNAFDCSGLTMAAWGAGGRRPAALLERAVRLRHPHLGEPAAAR